MPETFDSLDDLYITELKDLYSAETQLLEALPKMAQAASSPKLKKAFEKHLEQTKGQVERLEKIFEDLDARPGGHACKAMKGLIEEGEEVIKAKGDPAVKDAALIGAAQRVEHYEIAGYGTTRTFATHLGKDAHVKLLQATLDEEGQTNKDLTKLAEGTSRTEGINEDAES
jgi:ferritin-like metal-binding protein YciE